jgi:DNA uptake protein ComE-like DNA-binding protein
MTSGFEPVFGIVDEASKLNLNTATAAMLEKLPGVTTELAAAIVDWHDTTPSTNTAYARRQPPYRCKDANFESIEELALVDGADEITLYGEDANLNGILDPNEDDGDKSPPADNGDGKLDAGILNFVTVWSRESNKRSDGSNRTNTTDVGGLTQLFTDSFGAARASELTPSLGTNGATSPLHLFVVTRMSAAEFDQISDALTTNPTPATLPGLINVNTASEAVLACIPGMDAAKASTLVATRQKRAATTASIAWVAEVLSTQEIEQAGRYLTGRTFVVSADVVAVGHHGRGFRRTRFVVDHTGDTPQIVHRRNLAALGWPLGSVIRQSLATQSIVR